MWDKQRMQALIDTNDKAVARALVTIYRFQTDSERASHTTTNANNVGFSAWDAPLLSDIAEKCIRWRGLTPGQVRLVRPKIRRYWRQLCEIANAKEQAHQLELEGAAQSVANAAPDEDVGNAEEARMVRLEHERDMAQERLRMQRKYERELGLVAAGDHL